jgi:hypothetical protein
MFSYWHGVAGVVSNTHTHTHTHFSVKVLKRLCTFPTQDVHTLTRLASLLMAPRRSQNDPSLSELNFKNFALGDARMQSLSEVGDPYTH